MASYRHLARACVMQAIFCLEFREPSQTRKELLDKLIDEFAPLLEEKDFAYDLLEGVVSRKEEIFSIINEFATEWPVEKIAHVDRAILEIGVYEIVYTSVPSVVVINEAVELAKEFGDNSSGRFINGVLSNVMQKYENDTK
jgi:N utilization substance protein B